MHHDPEGGPASAPSSTTPAEERERCLRARLFYLDWTLVHFGPATLALRTYLEVAPPGFSLARARHDREREIEWHKRFTAKVKDAVRRPVA